jgi:hypothetical protein
MQKNKCEGGLRGYYANLHKRNRLGEGGRLVNIVRGCQGGSCGVGGWTLILMLNGKRETGFETGGVSS